MRYRTDGCGLDRLTTPIMICSADGFVLYKNDIAVKQVRLPKRHTDMKTHLYGSGREELKKVFELARPRVITIYTGDRYAKAFVTPYQWKGQDCSLWVFSAFLQSNPSGFFFTLLEMDLQKLGPDLCALIKNLEQQSGMAPGRSRTALERRIGVQLDRLIEELLATKTEKSFWRADESLGILKNQISDLFDRYGYQIDCIGELRQEHRIMYLNFRDFLAFYSHALTFCCEMTRNRKISLNMKSVEGEEAVDFQIKFTMMFPPFYTEKERDITKLLPYAPDHEVDILLFEKLVSTCGYKVSYSFLEKLRDNVEFRFRIPLTYSRGFSVPRDPVRELRLLEIDCNRFVECILENFAMAAKLAREEMHRQ